MDSALHVMLALHRSFRQIVVADRRVHTRLKLYKLLNTLTRPSWERGPLARSEASRTPVLPEKDSEKDEAKLTDVCTRASSGLLSPVMIVGALPIILIPMTIRAEWGKRFDLLGHKARQVRAVEGE